jgi:hypothetical protein
MKYRYKISNITSNDSVSLEIKAKVCQQEKKSKITWDLSYPT